MNRRDFLKRLGLVTAGIVAADQLEVIERLGWKRRFFPGFTEPSKVYEYQEFALGFMITREMLEDDLYAGTFRELAKKMEVRESFMDDTFVFTPRKDVLLHGHILSSAGKVDHLVLPREPGLITQGVMGGTHNPAPVLRPIRASALVGG
jgi:hypothetical protein